MKNLLFAVLFVSLSVISKAEDRGITDQKSKAFAIAVNLFQRAGDDYNNSADSCERLSHLFDESARLSETLNKQASYWPTKNPKALSDLISILPQISIEKAIDDCRAAHHDQNQLVENLKKLTNLLMDVRE